MFMENEQLERQKMIQAYREEVAGMMKYLPWLESKCGQQTSTTFSGSDVEKNSLPFPVYDSTLMSFVKALSATGLMNRNYIYDYHKYRIQTVQDELKFVEKATVKEIPALCSILSKYMMRGRTKGGVWAEGVTNGIYFRTLKKLKEIIEFWDKPLA